MNGEHVKVLSHFAAQIHNVAGGVVIRVNTMDVLRNVEPSHLRIIGAAIEVPGKTLPPKRIRERLFLATPEQKAEQDMLLWTLYDPPDNTTYVGLAKLEAP